MQQQIGMEGNSVTIYPQKPKINNLEFVQVSDTQHEKSNISEMKSYHHLIYHASAVLSSSPMRTKMNKRDGTLTHTTKILTNVNIKPTKFYFILYINCCYWSSSIVLFLLIFIRVFSLFLLFIYKNITLYLTENYFFSSNYHKIFMQKLNIIFVVLFCCRCGRYFSSFVLFEFGKISCMLLVYIHIFLRDKKYDGKAEQKPMKTKKGKNPKQNISKTTLTIENGILKE